LLKLTFGDVDRHWQSELARQRRGRAKEIVHAIPTDRKADWALAYMPGALPEYVHALPVNVDWIQNQLQYNWGRQATFLGFWRLLLQGRQVGPPWLIVRVLWATSALAVAAALAVAFLKARRTANRDALISAAIASTPLLLPYFMDYDLLLLSVPAVLFANDLMRRGTMSAAGRWTVRAWVALYLWAYLNPGLSGILHVSLTVPLLASLSACLFIRAGAAQEPAQAPERPQPVAEPHALAA